MERAYTVSEIDALRRTCRERAIWGTSYMSLEPGTGRTSGSYSATEMDARVENMVRTYMLAGIVAQDILTEDRQRYEQSRAALTPPQ